MYARNISVDHQNMIPGKKKKIWIQIQTSATGSRGRLLRSLFPGSAAEGSDRDQRVSVLCTRGSGNQFLNTLSPVEVISAPHRAT